MGEMTLEEQIEKEISKAKNNFGNSFNEELYRKESEILRSLYFKIFIRDAIIQQKNQKIDDILS